MATKYPSTNRVELLQVIAGALINMDMGGGGGGTGIAAVEDDPSPQLGGDLDLNGHNIAVNNAFRLKSNGEFQLFNPTTSKYHTLTISGDDGAVVIDLGAGEA